MLLKINLFHACHLLHQMPKYFHSCITTHRFHTHISLSPQNNCFRVLLRIVQFKINTCVQWLCHKTHWACFYINVGNAAETWRKPTKGPTDATCSISSAAQLRRFNLTLILWQIADNLEMLNRTHTLKQNGRGGRTNSDLLDTPIIPHSQVFHQIWHDLEVELHYKKDVLLSFLRSCCMKQQTWAVDLKTSSAVL